MNGRGKSDEPIVPRKPANNGGPAPAGSSAERVEGRGLAKGNPSQPNRPRTQGREGLQSALDRIRQATSYQVPQSGRRKETKTNRMLWLRCHGFRVDVRST